MTCAPRASSCPSLFALDTHSIVVRTGTMSKILGAGLRVGWLVAQPPLVKAVLSVKFDGGPARSPPASSTPTWPSTWRSTSKS